MASCAPLGGTSSKIRIKPRSAAAPVAVDLALGKGVQGGPPSPGDASVVQPDKIHGRNQGHNGQQDVTGHAFPFRAVNRCSIHGRKKMSRRRPPGVAQSPESYRTAGRKREKQRPCQRGQIDFSRGCRARNEPEKKAFSLENKRGSRISFPLGTLGAGTRGWDGGKRFSELARSLPGRLDGTGYGLAAAVTPPLMRGSAPGGGPIHSDLFSPTRRFESPCPG